MSNPSKRLEFEEYLHLEVYNNKESKLLLYLLHFPVDISTMEVTPGKKPQSLLLCVMQVLAWGPARTPGLEDTVKPRPG